MGYGDWVHLHITNRSSKKTMVISNIETTWGKFYQGPDDKGTQIQPTHLKGVQIAPKASFDVYSCGLENSPSGTTGNVEFSYDGEVAATVEWNCPYSGDNSLSGRANDGYYVTTDNYSTSGALGDKNVTVGIEG